MNGSEKVGTGCIIRRYDGDDILDEVTVIVLGDLDGDGQIKSMDALMALKAGVGTIAIDDIFYYAGNVDGVGRISSADALRILKYSVGTVASLN